MNSSTRISLVAAAVSTVLGTTAHALPPSAFSGPITTFYAGGGSAEVQAIYVAVSKLLTNVDVYTDGTGTSIHPQSLSYLIISGTAKQAFGSVASGSAVGFIYKYNGGSFPNGAQPEYTGSLLAYPTNAQIASTAATLALPTGGNAAQYPSSIYPDYKFTFSSTATTSVAPDWGITDEEPALFNYPDNLNNSAAITLSGATATPLYVAPFGVALTNAIYQYKHNFSKAEVAGILNGTVSDWSQLQGDTGTFAGTALPAGGIILIDRGSGSGTKAAGNDYFLDYPAGSYKIGGALQPESVTQGPFNANGGYTGALVLSATAQDIKEPSSAAEADDLVAANQAGLGAIAILGLEYPPAFEQHTAGTNDYWFVSINGSYPDTEATNDDVNSPTGGATQYSNVIGGKYDFAYQISFNTTHAPSTLSAFETAVYNNLSAASISGANTGLAFPQSTAGVLLDPSKFSGTAGSVSWTRNHNSAGAAVFIAAQPAANPDPLE
jgi:hypothetical protein